jgi:hypothetical protein
VDANEMDVSEMRLRFKSLLVEYVQTEIYEALDKIKWATIKSLAVLGFVYGNWYFITKYSENHLANSITFIVASIACYLALEKFWRGTAFANYKRFNKISLTSDMRVLGNNDLDESKYAIDPKTGRWNLHAGWWWH